MQIGVESARAVENKRIFVVDSDEIRRAVLQFMLHDENETHELGTPEDAYEKGKEWKPDLVLLGHGFIVERGLGLWQELRERLPTAKFALIVDTVDDSNIEPSLKAGASSVIAKPFTVEGVRRRVDLLLGRITQPLIQLQL